MSVYVSDKEMALLSELYDFYNTHMEGASLDAEGQAEYEENSKTFWDFYEKCKKARHIRNGKNFVKKILKEIKG